MSSILNDQLAGALAIAIAQAPRANLQYIAERAGISKATLYRISPTREGLIEMLLERSTKHLQDALFNAELHIPPYPDALLRLTEKLVQGRNFYMFWNAAHWIQMLDAKGETLDIPSFYGEALEEFFLKGQCTGVFRIDMAAKWLTKAYDYMLFAAVESAERGEIATVGMAPMVMKMFLNGAAEPTVARLSS